MTGGIWAGSCLPSLPLFASILVVACVRSGFALGVPHVRRKAVGVRHHGPAITPQPCRARPTHPTRIVYRLGLSGHGVATQAASFRVAA
jgi:hypothetical protein